MTTAQDPVAAYASDALTLAQLRGEYPSLHISVDFYGRTKAWVARGLDGHPWVVLSSDLDRFRAALEVSAPES